MITNNLDNFDSAFFNISIVRTSVWTISTLADYYFFQVAKRNPTLRNVQRSLEWNNLAGATHKGLMVFCLGSMATFAITSSSRVALAVGLGLDTSTVTYYIASNYFAN